MFDNENENEKWDNMDIDVNGSSDEPSWDDILDNAIVHDDDDFEDNGVNANSEGAFQGSYEGGNEVQSDYTQDYDGNNQTYDVIQDQDDEPVVETSSQSRETNNVLEVYGEGDTQPQQDNNDYTSFEAEVYNEQNAQASGVTGGVNGAQDYDSSKPIGIKQDKNNTTISAVLGVVVAVLLALAGYMLYNYLKDNDKIPSASDTKTVREREIQSDEDLFNDLDNSVYNNERGEQAGVQEQQQAAETPEASETGDKVVVNVVNTGRSNPFTPTGNFSVAGYTLPTGLDILGPPALDKDVTPNKLVDIVVSGILYDNTKPSAIITIGGIDHFVQRGDSIDEYVVSYIGPTSVTIRTGKNTYTASIGQQFNVNDKIDGETTYIKGKSGTTRQYFTPSSEDIDN